MDRDEDLLADGGEAAMTQLIGRYERPLFCFLCRMTADAQLAEDLFQETFLRLNRSRASYRPEQPLKAYVYGIALNLVRDALAKRAHQPTVSLNGACDAQVSLLGERIAAAGFDPKHQLLQLELKEQVRSALNRLPAYEREVLVLRIFENLSFAEIAQITEVPLATAKSRLIYALRRLRPTLEGYVQH